MESYPKWSQAQKAENERRWTNRCFVVLGRLSSEEDDGVLDEGPEDEQDAGQHPGLDGCQA